MKISSLPTMNKWISVALPMLALLFAVVGVAAQVNPAAGVARISVEELKKLAKSGNVIIVDTRTVEAFKIGHIPGSVLISNNEIPEKAKALPRDKTIVTYCT